MDPENVKVCPLCAIAVCATNMEIGAQCVEEKCAWWHAWSLAGYDGREVHGGQCAMLSIAKLDLP